MRTNFLIWSSAGDREIMQTQRSPLAEFTTFTGASVLSMRMDIREGPRAACTFTWKFPEGRWGITLYSLSYLDIFFILLPPFSMRFVED